MLSPRELATVLAALQYWQSELAATDEIIDGGEHFSDHHPLTADEIDDLCERLNFTAGK
jgi:hypothetical protein